MTMGMDMKPECVQGDAEAEKKAGFGVRDLV